MEGPTRWLLAHSLSGFPSPPVPFGAARRTTVVRHRPRHPSAPKKRYCRHYYIRSQRAPLPVTGPACNSRKEVAARITPPALLTPTSRARHRHSEGARRARAGHRGGAGLTASRVRTSSNRRDRGFRPRRPALLLAAIPASVKGRLASTPVQRQPTKCSRRRSRAPRRLRAGRVGSRSVEDLRRLIQSPPSVLLPKGTRFAVSLGFERCRARSLAFQFLPGRSRFSRLTNHL